MVIELDGLESPVDFNEVVCVPPDMQHNLKNLQGFAAGCDERQRQNVKTLSTPCLLSIMLTSGSFVLTTSVLILTRFH